MLRLDKYNPKFWLSQSDFQEKEYRRLGLPLNMPVYRAPNPINTDIFYPPKAESKKLIIGWTGKNNWAKHPEFLVKIASYFPNILFYCFSDAEVGIPSIPNIRIFKGATNQEVAEGHAPEKE